MSAPCWKFRPRWLAGLLAVLLFAAPGARATWSLVVVDSRTGEVLVASATCLTNLDLKDFVPLVLVGVGGAAAQSSIDGSGANRRLIWDEMQKGTSPNDIIALLRQSDSNHQSRQYGIADVERRRRTFTGRNTSAWAGGVVGRDGSVVYAIQGNILVGPEVVDDAEQAFLTTAGPLPERVMAAMEAAAARGGDSRCTGRGKSADIGFMVGARVGDVDGTCGAGGCANGVYYMDLNVANQRGIDPDPVIQLRSLFDAWRAGLRGRPDHNESRKSWIGGDEVPGNGTSLRTLVVQLVDFEGFDLTTGGAQVRVEHAEGSAGLSSIGPVVDNGDGSYQVDVVAGVGQGVDIFDVFVDDGQGEIQLAPRPVLPHGETLIASTSTLSAGAGGSVDFDLIGPEANPGRAFLLLGTNSGTDPGQDIGGITLPLNQDYFFLASIRQRNGPIFVDNLGRLGTDGQADASFVVPPGALNALVGTDVHFAYLTLGPVDFPSNPIQITITP